MMAGFSLAALLVGAAVSFWVPVMPFVLGLMGAVVTGLMVAALRHVPTGQALLWTVALSASAQVGFVLGLAAWAALRGLRGRTD
jgi:hypothetical protein